MSYAVKIDEFVGKHVAEFQAELTLARLLGRYINNKPILPYGYPVEVYRPLHTCKVSQVKRFVARTGRKMSNGVPRILGMNLVNHYVLGLYNPVKNT